MEKTRLNLACGKDYREGYINVDNLSMFIGKVDIIADVKEFTYEINAVDEILVSHFAMYCDQTEMKHLIFSSFMWLKNKGTLIIETGDLKKIAKTILESEDPRTINGTNGVMQLFGINETKGHTWAWCYETLEPLLIEAGFSSITRMDGGLHNRPERDITIIARK